MKKFLLLTILSLFITTSTVSAQMGGLFGWWMLLVQILVLVILVLLVIYLFKKVKSSK
ncbi:MAG: hypothetical protein ACK4FL_02080 [Microgenomates group bacterium]